jgi:hypothetical protein
MLPINFLEQVIDQKKHSKLLIIVFKEEGLMFNL